MIVNALKNAKWIWCNEEVNRCNQNGLFRRVIELPDDPGRVLVHACADMRYWLYVNGARVGFGPGKFDPRTPLYNTHDVTGLVHAGENLVAFKVHSIGPVERCSSFMPTRAGLIASVAWDGGEAVTDGSWKAIEETAYDPDTPRFCNHQSFIECFDARAAKTDWERVGYDDGDWPAAFVPPEDELAPWGEPQPNPIRPLSLVPRSPCRVIEVGRSVPRGDWRNMHDLAPALQESERFPADVVTFDADTGFWPITLTAPEREGEAAYAVFDFAENHAGYLTFRVRGAPGTIIDLGYGEDFAKGIVRCNLQGVRYADRFILGEGPLEHQLMFPKTLRYLLIEVRGGAAAFEHVGQDVSTFPVRWDGGFSCPGEPGLAQVWRIGAHTVQLCMEDVFLDTARRERAGWLGDMIPEAMAAYYAFGEYEVARHSLELFMCSQRPEGWLVGRFPSLDGPNMPSWSASFGMGLADYVRCSGDVDFARRMWPGVTGLTQWFESRRQADDLLVVCPTKRGDTTTSGYVLVDWAPTKLDGAVAVMNMFYYRYLADCAWTARLIGEEAEAGRLEGLAGRTKKAIRKHMFDQDRGIFCNCRDENGLSRQAGYQENLLALLWDIATPKQARRITASLLPDDAPMPVWRTADRNWLALSTGTEPWDEEQIVPIGSPFFMYYALGALFETGRATAAINNILTHYGDLLAQGETTVWEDFSGDTSRSHGWGAGPTVCMGRYVLGVEPIDPGFRTFSVLPSFGDLQECSGRVPTPHGVIGVAWERSAKETLLRITVPEGTEAVGGLPTNLDFRKMIHSRDGKALRDVQTRRGSYLVQTLPPGEHTIRALRAFF